MKVIAYLSVLIIVIVLAISFFVALTPGPSNAPRFIDAQPFAVTGLHFMAVSNVFSPVNYDFLGPRPFEAGKMWIGFSIDSLVYDIEKRQVLGQLTNGWPALLFGDPPQLLCYQPTSVIAPNRLRGRLLSFVMRICARISHGRIRPPPSMAGLRYWLLDLKSNAANRLGDIPGNPNTLFPSPDFHYCFISQIGQKGYPEVYLLDLRRRLIEEVGRPAWGWSFDWWNNTQFLVLTTNHNFVLFDVGTKAVSPFIPLEKVATFLRERNLSEDPTKTQTFAIWNGFENDFYLTDTHQKWLADESFLIKVQRPDGSLKLLSPRFKFGWSDHLDRTGRFYLYSGRDSGDSSDGVFLRDLETGTNRILVAPTTNKYFSIPRFYRDSVIYVRSNALWQISLDGASNVRLFPPVKPGEESGQ